eukprot:6205639-Pleurochrysis_carterae.AAC.1
MHSNTITCVRGLLGRVSIRSRQGLWYATHLSQARRMNPVAQESISYSNSVVRLAVKYTSAPSDIHIQFHSGNPHREVRNTFHVPTHICARLSAAILPFCTAFEKRSLGGSVCI